MLKAVLLDLDGTLLDSNDAHAESWAAALVEVGYNAKASDVRSLIGMGSDKLLPELIGYTAESEIGQKVSNLRRRIFKERYIDRGRIHPFPGTRELLQKMRSVGLKLMIASSAETEMINDLLKLARIEDLIEKQTSKDDVTESKPSPDIIHSAINGLKMRAEDVLLLGDTPYDIEAASKAAVGTVALLCGGWSAVELRDAISIYQDPADLLLHFETSPFGAMSTTDVQQAPVI